MIILILTFTLIALIVFIIELLYFSIKAEMVDLSFETSLDRTQIVRELLPEEGEKFFGPRLGVIIAIIYLATKMGFHGLESFSFFDVTFLFSLICLDVIICKYYNMIKSASTIPGYSIKTKSYSGIEFVGKAILPKKVYEGDSHNISVNLKPNFKIPLKNGGPPFIQDTKDSSKLNVLQILENTSGQQFLELDFSAAGLEVDGEKKQKRPLNSQPLSYQWNCYFPNSGNHKLSLNIRLVGLPTPIELGTIEYGTKVVKIDNLTKRQVWIVSSLASIISGGVILAELLHQLGVW